MVLETIIKGLTKTMFVNPFILLVVPKAGLEKKL